ncbi:MAG: hypothetical protein KatS3mg022_0940 [Armatimonadota bacterium]|nr:MAG: hypothetical protein KatS3mg022_0940 [Armatimonadota bacterium]
MVRRTGWTLRTGGSLVLFLCMLFASAGAEPVVLPPVWTEAQWVQHLISAPVDKGEQMEMGYHLLARTNVRPLLGSTAVEQPFAGEHGYYRFASLSEIRLCLPRWQVSYAFGVADRFDGDQGAVHLYLGGVNLMQIPASDADVSATLNRSAVNRWTVTHLVPLRDRRAESWLLVAGSLYLSRRIQQGTLTGRWQNAQFDGSLSLDTTLGLNPADTRSTGLGLHLAASIPLSERWRVGFWGENLLGHIWQRKIQRITARVQANTIVPDADGFLHAAPLLSGRIDHLSEELSLQRKVTLGMAYRCGNGTWLFFVSRDTEQEFTMGYASPRGWFLLSLPRGEWQVGYHTGQWQMTIGLSGLNLTQAKCATIGVRWSAPLGREHPYHR